MKDPLADAIKAQEKLALFNSLVSIHRSIKEGRQFAMDSYGTGFDGRDELDDALLALELLAKEVSQ